MISRDHDSPQSLDYSSIEMDTGPLHASQKDFFDTYEEQTLT